MRYPIVLALAMTVSSVCAQGSGFTFNYSGPTEILVGQDCEAPLQWGHPNTPTVTSNLPGGVIVSFTIYSISGGYQIGDMIPGGSTVTVFYQALDNFGNTALFGFSINFIDNIPPVFDPQSLPPPNITVSCSSNLPPPAMVEATDNCDNENTNLTITYTQTGTVPPCGSGTITRKWVADDDLGNKSTFTQVITVTADVTPPVIANNLVNGTAPCATAMAAYTTWLNTQRANFSATDAGCGVMTLSDNAPSPAIITSFCGAVDVTFTAKDNCNNTSTVVKTFTITNNVPPVIDLEAEDGSGNCSQPNIQAVFNSWLGSHGGATATDDCSSVLWSTYPPNPTLADTCNAAIEVLFIAGDGCNNFDTTSASFLVMDMTPPTVSVQATTKLLGCTTNGIDSLLMEWLDDAGESAASDLCTPAAALTVGYAIGTDTLTLEGVLDAWADSLAAGCKDGVFINGIGINNVKGYIPVTFLWTDRCGNATGTTGYFGLTDNGRPVFQSPPRDTAFTCAQGSDWEPAFLAWYGSAGYAIIMDACSDVTLAGSITADSAIQYLAAAFDTACAQGAFVTIAFSATDDCGNTSTMMPSATFSLSDTLAPVLLTPASDLAIGCAGDPQAQLEEWLDMNGGATAEDGCGELSWQFQWTDTTGLHTGIPGTGPYPQIGNAGCNASFEILFLALDPCQNAVGDTASVLHVDTLAPVISLAVDTLFLGCLEPVPGDAPMVTDDCDPAPQLSFEDIASPDSCVGRPAWISRTWTAADACANTAQATIVYITLDTIAPTFDLPAVLPDGCEPDSLSLENLADNCDPNPTITWSDEFTGSTCDLTLTRTWTVTDACGNAATAIQVIPLVDDTPPVIALSPGHFVFECDPMSPDLQGAYDAWRSNVQVEDGCSNPAWFIGLAGTFDPSDTMSWPGQPLPMTVMAECGANPAIEAILVAYDECGNFTVEPISFTITDAYPPAFVDCPERIDFEADTSCMAKIQLTPPMVTEICLPDSLNWVYILDGGEPASFQEGFLLDTVLQAGLHHLLWRVTDCAGLAGECAIILAVISEEALSVQCPVDTLVFTDSASCTAILPVKSPILQFGDCSQGLAQVTGYVKDPAGNREFTFDDPQDTLFIDFIVGTSIVSLVAGDISGDVDTCRYVVTLLDTIAPALSCDSDTILVTISGLDTIYLDETTIDVSVSDACGIQSLSFDPPYVTCAEAGQDFLVDILAADPSGNPGSCLANLHVAIAPVEPGWARGICDDTLRLFSGIPDTQAMNYTFLWSGPNGFSSDLSDPVIADSDTTNSGTYSVFITGPTGCSTHGATEVQVTEFNAPILTVADDTICEGEAIELTSTLYGGMVTYSWYVQLPSGDSLLAMTDVPILAVTGLPPGSYGFYAQALQDTCSTDPGPAVNAEVIALPAAMIADLTDFLCANDSLYLSPASVSDTLAYLWMGPGGFTSDLAEPPGIAAEAFAPSGWFYLQVSNGLCASNPDSVLVSVQPTPEAPLITGDTLTCEGGQFELYASGDADMYLWFDPQGIQVTDDDTLTVSPAFISQAGDWRVLAIVNGCPGDPSTGFAVAVDTGILIVIDAPVKACDGDEILFATTPVIPGNYSWSGPGGYQSDEAMPVIPVASGTYEVVVQTATGCESMASHAIEVDLRPQIDFLFADGDSCVDGMTPVAIHSISQPGYNAGFEYQWSGPGAFTVQDSSIVLTAPTSAASGEYTLVIANGICLSDTANILLALTDIPDPPAIDGNAMYCDGDTIRLDISMPLPGATYTWILPDTTFEIPSPGSLVIPAADATWSGSYQVTIEADGCRSEPATIDIDVMAILPLPVIEAPALVCEGDSLVLAASVPSGAIVTWSGPNGYTSQGPQAVIYPFTANEAGAYSVNYRLGSCDSPASDPFVVSIQPTLQAPGLVGDNTSICLDAPVPFTVCIDPQDVLDGASYTLYANDAIILAGPSADTCFLLDATNLAPGTNTLTAVSSLNGCTSERGVAWIIQADEYPMQSADAGLDMTLCPNEPFLLSGSDPSPGTGQWTTPDAGVIFGDPSDPMTSVSGLPAGQYIFQWTLSYASCPDYSTASVMIDVLPSPVAVPDTVMVPFGRTEEFVVTLNDSLEGIAYFLEIVSGPYRGNALHAGNGIFRYSPNIGYVGLDSLVYRICSAECPTECSETVIRIQVGDDSDCFVPTLFTPNNDGINDRLIIPCLETTRYPDNRIQVYNEWGALLYEAGPYTNDWDGTFNGESLPVGTYFYILDFGDGSAPRRTFLVIER